MTGFPRVSDPGKEAEAIFLYDLSSEVTYPLLPLDCIGHTDQLLYQVGTVWEGNTQILTLGGGDQWTWLHIPLGENVGLW